MKAFFRGAVDVIFFLGCVVLYCGISFTLAFAILASAAWQRCRRRYA